MADERVERVAEAERLLEELGEELLPEIRGDEELWPLTAMSLAAHARSHHRALLEGLAGSSPRASQINARPIVETTILMHYLVEEPEVRVWAWIAHSIKEQLKMLREWRTAVEEGNADDASLEELTELIERKEAEVAKVEEEAKKAAAELGQELEKVEFPSMYKQAERDPQLFGLYTKGFRHLSGSVHVAATLFTANRYDAANSILSDSLSDEDRLAIRVLAAAVLAVIYADAGRALGQDELVEKTGAVHAAMMGINAEPAD
jgi:Family of unknown function (DUF5677)